MELPKPLKGPTSTSNWIYPGRFLIGAYPGNRESPDMHELMVQKITDTRINTFISLIHDEELSHFRPYQDVALKINPNISFYRYGIRDRGVTSDEQLREIVNMIIDLLNSGRNIYLHCWGGHGRTGTVVAVLLGHLHHLTGDDALKLTQELRMARDRPFSRRGHRKGLTLIQEKQVRKFLN